MISFDAFWNALCESAQRNPNSGQRNAIEAVPPLFVIAGLGTGKTAALTKRVLGIKLKP